MERNEAIESHVLWAAVFAENVMISYATFLFCCDFVATKRVTKADYEKLDDLSIDE
jgi:hypothetical protein